MNQFEYANCKMYHIALRTCVHALTKVAASQEPSPAKDSQRKERKVIDIKE